MSFGALFRDQQQENNFTGETKEGGGISHLTLKISWGVFVETLTMEFCQLVLLTSV